jgi:hypothetical protein
MSSREYYVYALTRPNGSPFYIGKGQGKRILQHDYEARKGHQCHKCYLIRKLWRDGQTFGRAILFRTTNEQDAFDMERQLIAVIGRNNLTNLTDGGEGTSGMVRTKEMIEKQVEARKVSIASNPETHKRIAMACALAAQPFDDCYPGVKWVSGKRKWRAGIHYKTERHFIGYFDDELTAISARRAAETYFYGECLFELPSYIDSSDLPNYQFVLTDKKKRRGDNMAGYAGVSYQKRNDRWDAEIFVNKKKIYVGSSPVREMAIIMRRKAEIDYFGEYLYDAPDDILKIEHDTELLQQFQLKHETELNRRKSIRSTPEQRKLTSRITKQQWADPVQYAKRKNALINAKPKQKYHCPCCNIELETPLHLGRAVRYGHCDACKPQPKTKVQSCHQTRLGLFDDQIG